MPSLLTNTHCMETDQHLEIKSHWILQHVSLKTDFMHMSDDYNV